MILNLISSPRTISTALMYSFSQRPDTKVIDEPFYAYYLTWTRIPHPGFDEIIKSQPTDPFGVVREIDRIYHEHKVVFLKGMAHHLLEDFEFLPSWQPIFLIRNPAQIISSFSKVIESPTLNDVGIKRQWELYQFLTLKGCRPVVVDSNRILDDPESGLTRLCDSLGLKFDERMLNWKPGPIPEDGIWAKYWYKNVHASTGFSKSDKTSYKIESRFQNLLEEAQPYFEYLSEKRLF